MVGKSRPTVEPGRQNQGVDEPFGAVARDDAVGLDLLDTAGLEIHARFGECVVKELDIVGRLQPSRNRGQLAPQLLVTDRQKPMDTGQVRRSDVESRKYRNFHIAITIMNSIRCR